MSHLDVTGVLCVLLSVSFHKCVSECIFFTRLYWAWSKCQAYLCLQVDSSPASILTLRWGFLSCLLVADRIRAMTSTGRCLISFGSVKTSRKHNRFSCGGWHLSWSLEHFLLVLINLFSEMIINLFYWVRLESECVPLGLQYMVLMPLDLFLFKSYL